MRFLSRNWSKRTKNERNSELGVTLIEVILVLSLMAFMLVIMAPNIHMSEANEVTSKLGKLSSDIRSAYDSAVLSGHTHRLGFDLGKGVYWLEATEAENVKLGAGQLDRELTPEEEVERAEKFEREFERYVDLAAKPVTDPDTGKDVKVDSPVTNAKEALMGPKWKEVTSGEWAQRELGDYLMIKDMKAYHHQKPISMSDSSDKAIAYIYFFPSGYIEPFYIHIGYRGKDGSFNEQKSPYTITANSYEGYAEVKDGFEEVILADPQ